MIKNKKGFTLIEAVVVLTLTGILTFGMGNFIVTAIRAWVLISERNAAVNLSCSAMNRMVTEIRRMNGTASINTTTTSSSECVFTDIDGNAIDLVQSGGSLYLNGTGGNILATGLTTPRGINFTYLNASGNSLSIPLTAANVASVRIWLSLSSTTQTITLESSARIRNP